jgi:hypothetical protein
MKDGLPGMDLALPLSDHIPDRHCDDPDDQHDPDIDDCSRRFVKKSNGFETLNQVASGSRE